MKTFISGEIADGLSSFSEVKAKFAAAEKILTEQGHEVISQLKNGLPYNAPKVNHTVMNIILLMSCEAIYLLPDWELSSQSTLEKRIAELTGKQIIYQKKPAFVELKQAIEQTTGIAFYKIASHKRQREYVYARMIYAQFCKQQGETITNISAEMQRTHSAVIYYIRKFDDEKKYNPKFREMQEEVMISIKQPV